MKLAAILLFLFSSLILAQETFVTVDDTITGKPMLVGEITREAFLDSNFGNWFNSEYLEYRADTTTLTNLNQMIEHLNIKIVLGTWCSDSRLEVPRFFKILDYLSFPENNLSIICVDRDKHGMNSEVDELNINFVPTIIFYKNDDELGRIIETPDESLEEDFFNIVE